MYMGFDWPRLLASDPMESTLEEVEKFAAKLERASERVFKSRSVEFWIILDWPSDAIIQSLKSR